MSTWLELLGLVVLGFVVVILIARFLGTTQSTASRRGFEPQGIEK